MTYLGVNIAILQAGQVLLTQREDFEVWCLPGGGVDPGESVAQAAVREAWEETGLKVELTRLVGIYSRPHWLEEGTHIVVFAAKPVGGAVQPEAGEVLQARYFSLAELPDLLLFGQRQRIIDALQGVCGVVWSQEEVWPFAPDLSRDELYALRDRSGLSRQEFYIHHFVRQDGQSEKLEVGPYEP